MEELPKNKQTTSLGLVFLVADILLPFVLLACNNDNIYRQKLGI
jgi:hypothetical protein